MSGWQFWIDVGGTFTDCVARSPDGILRTHKTLSSGAIKGQIDSIQGNQFSDRTRCSDPSDFWIGWNFSLFNARGEQFFQSKIESFSASDGSFLLADPFPEEASAGHRYELTCGLEAPVICIRQILELPLHKELPPITLRMGTTRGTNALLERKGANTALLITNGFSDLLLIGNQDRPELFALNIEKPSPLFRAVIEIDERINAEGKVLKALDLEAARKQLEQLRSNGTESIAIALLHSYRNPDHELQLGSLACELGFSEVSLSHAVSPTIKIVPRAETTVLDAYLNPVLRSYVERIRSSLAPGSDMKLMTSQGGLVEGLKFTGKDSLLSGPAGGVVAYSRISSDAGFARSIGFDMGGTSTDVSRFGGTFEMEAETVKAGVRIASPTLAIETVAAGGGSICHFDGLQLRVGPDSAGANPGPACYGRGGPLTITDMNVVLGRVRPEEFPFPLDRNAIESQLQTLCDQLKNSLGTSYSLRELAQGFVDIANETMARAIRKVSVQRGFHPGAHLMVSFGGAGGLHACAISRSLGIESILIHPFCGILSAYGMGLADIRKRGRRSVLKRLTPELLTSLSVEFDDLVNELKREIREEGISENEIPPAENWFHLRYAGGESTLAVRDSENQSVRDAFQTLHQQTYGYVHEDRDLEVVAIEVEVVGETRRASLSERSVQASAPEKRVSQTQVWHQGTTLNVPVYHRENFAAGDEFEGPAILCDLGATTWVEPGFRGRLLEDGSCLISGTEHVEARAIESANAEAPPDPIRLEVFNHQFASIAEQMGATLQKTSISTNVKERLDFSCAIFDAKGQLVVNAPHIPVHLGAMGETVRAVMNEFQELAPGDVVVTNDPYSGGSHLPDVTVITPVHDQTNGQLLFFTASRAHHAEIGGMTPGSMPPFSKSLHEEGVLIRPFKLVEGGLSREEELRRRLSSGEFPSRSPEDNLADLQAQVAANRTGEKLLLEMIHEAGQDVVLTYMQHIQDLAAKKMRRALHQLADGEYDFADHLDNGAKIAVKITIAGETATIDFTGTDPVLDSNLNANRAIVTAACMYVFRCLINESIPLNEGVLMPLKIVLPESLLNPPSYSDPKQCAAIVGGNVETSQRVVDVLLGALDQAAASQGTMNNLTFGDESFGYYETICGGVGATPTGNGADAVHSHMTNTRLTDVEVIEHRYPVRVEQFSIRKGSGGSGKFRGGDGISRTLVFERPLKVSLLTQRRGEFLPYGLNGGASGLAGENRLTRASGETIKLDGCVHLQVEAGDKLMILTPGGGGWGDAKQTHL
ncbi:Acetophenone carboxylase gamma subunit [Thalassoglobus neptunius]|uniref:Acetophenone carboxylase gamma subunit n=1 Tax=Thalassoglobus neptunius TaxID=1938619 RepID=A0A5C5X3G6_9PLAN|nr:Acetophenone carboxylase gamma subunit [Thalassoglobus neptunius]